MTASADTNPDTALRAEDLLLRHLLTRLGKLPALPPHQVIGGLPRRLTISPEFAADYQSLTRAILLKGLSRAFGFRSFYLQADDSTQALRSTDPAFWANLHPRLSRAALDWLWWDYGAGAKPEQALTAWDTLLLQLLGHERTLPLPAPQTLLANQDWPVLAWLLLSRRADMPLLGPLWDLGANLAYPLRFVLIERSAAWFAGQNAWWSTRLSDRSFGMAEYRELQQLAQQARFDTIPTQLQAWQSSQMQGYDDALWIGRELAHSRLLPELQTFRTLVANLGELGDRS